jgi:hypothetical protein
MGFGAGELTPEQLFFSKYHTTLMIVSEVLLHLKYTYEITGTVLSAYMHILD